MYTDERQTESFDFPFDGPFDFLKKHIYHP